MRERSGFMKIYGYVRVSSESQNEDRQMLTMSGLKIPESHIFVDKISGKDFNRPAYKKLMNKLEAGDLLYVCSIDRLGRNYADIVEQWRIITKERGIDIAVIDMPLLNTRTHKDLLGTLIADLVLSLLSYVSESERTAIKTRQREGIIAAKARGVHFGRTVITPCENFATLVKQWESVKITFE